MKKHCLDEEHSIKPKKREEYDCHSDKVVVIESLADRLEEIKYKLENKRIMRSKRENKKNSTRKAFNRDIESLKRFLPKYTSKDFDDAFEIIENKVSAPANHFVKKREG